MEISQHHNIDLLDKISTSESLIKTISNNVVDNAIILLNDQGDIISWNKGAEIIKGYKEDEIFGSHFSVFFTENDKKMNIPQRLLDDTKKNGNTSREGWSVKKGGSTFWKKISLTAVYDSEQTVVGYLEISQDLSHRKNLELEMIQLNEKQEKKLKRKTKQLEKSNKELDAFTYSISHDLRAPLRSINGFSEMLLEDCGNKMDEGGLRIMNIIKSSGKKMEMLIEGLLHLSKLSRMEMSKTSFNMNDLCNEILAELNSYISSKDKISLQIKSLNDCYGDRFMLKHVLTHLIENAIKYSKVREIQNIEIGSSIEENYTVYYIKDNGTGFDMRHKNKLFGIFQRLHRETEFEGIGIGLAQSQKIIKKHKGEIWAEGEINQGATFYFSIPVKK